jgi:hypothetical protein
VAARPITFLSDYGYQDEFAGVCRAVIARISPDSRVIDLTHAIPRHDVKRGAAALERALPFTPAGVHLAVVDPGVGTERRPLAVRVAEDERVLVGPDNGLLSPAISALGGAVEAADLTGSAFALDRVSETFHGRDLFAPVAAQVANGASIGEVGDAIGPETLFRATRFEPLVEPGRLVAHVADIDGFGNVALDASGQDLSAASSAGSGSVGGNGAEVQPATIEIAGLDHRATRGKAFGEVPEGGLLLYVDSSGRAALAVNRGSAADDLGLEPGDEIAIRLDTGTALDSAD